MVIVCEYEMIFVLHFVLWNDFFGDLLSLNMTEQSVDEFDQTTPEMTWEM